MRQGYPHLIRFMFLALAIYFLAPTSKADLVEAWSYNINSARAAVSDSGGVYVIGVPTSPAEDATLHRLRSDGTLHWTRVWDTGDRDFAEDFVLDNRGYAYIHVRSYAEGSGNSMVLLCYDSLGTKLWEDWPDVPSLGTWDDNVHGMDVSINGHLALSGIYVSPSVSHPCDSSRPGVFLIGYGPTGPGSRWIETIEDDDSYMGNESVAVSPAGTVISPVNYFGPVSCFHGPDCDWIEGCEPGRTYEVRNYNSGGALHSSWPESMETRVKFFDDGSYCVWESDYNFNGDQALRYYGSDGFVDWNVSLNLTIFQPYKDGLGNVYVIAAWYAPDSSPGEFASSVSNIYHIMKFSPTGSVLADLVFDEHSNIFTGAVLPDGRFFAVASIGLWPDNEYVLQAYDPNLNIVDDIVLSTGSDTHYIFGQDAEGAIYVRSDGRIRKFETSKKLTIVDINGDAMANLGFELIRVENNPPVYSEDTLGTVTTDSDGMIELTPRSGDDSLAVEITGGTALLSPGDLIKLSKNPHATPAVKHPSVLGTMYSIHLDNAKFDQAGAMSFYEVGGDQDTIVMDHTELRYNLLVSIEWDASIEYWDQIDDNFRAMSNYLYDVTDGQVRLDTIMIFDDAEHWSQADVWIVADNIEWPRVVGTPPGIFTPASSAAGQILMPRRWFGNQDACRNLSASNHPLNLVHPNDYRTKAHEFGHYALGFYDEYWFRDPATGTFLKDAHALRCNPAHLFNYGYMDRQYDDQGANSSELSSKYGYQLEACQNTKQFVLRGMSCWDYLERWVEATLWGTENVLVPILKPDREDSDERSDLTGDIFVGPNNDMAALDYDVGGRVVFTHPVRSPEIGIGHIHITAHHSTGGDRAEVQIINEPSLSSSRTLKQGQTADDGTMWIIGANVLDCDIEATKGITQATVVRTTKSFRSSASPWLSGGASVGGSSATRHYPYQLSLATDDSLTIELTELSGDYPMLFALAFSGDAAALTILSSNPLPSQPTVDLATAAAFRSFEVDVIGNGYQAPMADSLGGMGTFTLRSTDDLAHPFLVPVPYVLALKDTASGSLAIDATREAASIWIDSANTGLTASMVLSTSYPVPLDGLGPEAVKVGETHSIALYPSTPLTGDNQITFNYDDADLVFDGEVVGDEATLDVFRWDYATEQWEPLSGTVNTETNAVQAPFSEAGIYAAFTNQIVTDVDDEEQGDLLPYRFDLSQNYPNPFNPVTTIEYSLPERSEVTIEVFNVLGQRVRTLVSREESAGSHTISWDGLDQFGNPVATGVYLYRFQAGDYTETKKMLLLK